MSQSVVNEPAISLTESAAARICAIVEPGQFVRLSVSGGGCSGFQYGFSIESEAATDDVRIVRAGATLLVDPVSLELIAGSEVDFLDNLVGAAFAVKNPQAKSSCGCGNSFSLG